MAGLGLRFRGGFRALLGILAEQVDVQNAEEGVDDDESREREPYRGRRDRRHGVGGPHEAINNPRLAAYFGHGPTGHDPEVGQGDHVDQRLHEQGVVFEILSPPPRGDGQQHEEARTGYHEAEGEEGGKDWRNVVGGEGVEALHFRARGIEGQQAQQARDGQGLNAVGAVADQAM